MDENTMKTLTNHVKPSAAIFEPSPVRLTVEETKIIIRLSAAAAPLGGDSYQFTNLANGLVDLGIARRVEITEERDTAARIKECWQRARRSFAEKDSAAVHQAMHDIERISSDRDRNSVKFKFELTDVGKQLARGIAVKLNGAARR